MTGEPEQQPFEGNEDDEPAEVQPAGEPPVKQPPVMGVEISNAIVTRAPLTIEQLVCAIDHYAALEAMLRRSGPRFTNARRDAADMHNRTLALLREAEERPNGTFDPPRHAPLPA